MGALVMGLAACIGGDGFKAGHPGAIGVLEPLPLKNPTFTVNAVTIEAPGKEVEVLRVRALATPNMQMLGTQTTWPRDARGSSILSAMGYPSPSVKTYHPAIGVVIPAAETAFVHQGESEPRSVFVNVGFRLASGDVGLVHAMEVTYRAGAKTKTERSHTATLACISPCKAEPEDVAPSEWEQAVRKDLGVVTSDSRDLPEATEP
jgi:hypothetical protein